MIIGILSAVAIPKLFGIKDSAKISAEVTDITNMNSEIAKLHGEWILNDSFSWDNANNPTTDWNNSTGFPNNFGSALGVEYILGSAKADAFELNATADVVSGTASGNCSNSDITCYTGQASGGSNCVKSKTPDVAGKPDCSDYWEYNKTSGELILRDLP